MITNGKTSQAGCRRTAQSRSTIANRGQWLAAKFHDGRIWIAGPDCATRLP
jgi:hypothetical protein